MEINSLIRKISGIIFCLSVLLYLFFSTRTSRLIFCDVGQGTATFLSLGSTQILIDTGPDMRVLPCIGKYMPFFDRTIEVIIISHNQKDHTGALQTILKKYKVNHVIGPAMPIDPPRNTQVTIVKKDVAFQIKQLQFSITKASTTSTDANESANVVTIRTPYDVIFLPSDIDGFELKRLIPPMCTILEIPHHGSKYGLYPDSLLLAHPTLAVISVGKKNTYGHPSKDALNILKAAKIPIWRTDLQGELVIDL